MNYINRPENAVRKENFIKLRDRLVELYGNQAFNKSFNMASFCIDEEEVDGHDLAPCETNCGTTMCVLGHAPAVVPPQVGLSSHSWREYAHKNFVSEKNLYRDWSWCFSTTWSDDIQQAIKRLTHYIDDKIDPSKEDWFHENQQAIKRLTYYIDDKIDPSKEDWFHENL